MGVEAVGERNNSYSDFLADLHQMDGDADDCRYGVYDYDYQFNPDGAESTFKSKIFLMCWCPDSSKIKKKMLYSSSFDTLKELLSGFTRSYRLTTRANANSGA